MEENNEKPQDSGNMVERNPDGTFKDGHKKLGGKALGTRDFATDFDEAVEEIAEENKMTKSAVRKLLLKVAYKNAKEGNYSFYKDIHDRLYGTALNKTELRGEVILKISKEIADKYETNTSTSADSEEQE